MEQYIENKVEGWLKDLQLLVAINLCIWWSSSSILSIHQRIMYCSTMDPFLKNSTRHKWFIQPLENAIDQLILALIEDKWGGRKNNRSSSQAWWARFEKSLGNWIWELNSDHCTTSRSNLPKNSSRIQPFRAAIPRNMKSRIRKTKNTKCRNSHNELFEELTPESQLMKAATEKGASSWLSALPIKLSGDMH